MHTENFVFSGLLVSGVGESSYPINRIQAQALVQAAYKVPFGKSTQTILESTVRRAWEIDTTQPNFKGLQWNAFLNKVVPAAKRKFGAGRLRNIGKAVQVAHLLRG